MRDHSKCEKNENIHLRVSNKSEKMLIKDRTFTFSTHNIVMVPATTGKDKSKRMASGIQSKAIPADRMLTVVIKFTAPRIEETPAK